MEDKACDGGQAFPRMVQHHDSETNEPIFITFDGLTIRDYFAGQVLTANLVWDDIDKIANGAYLMADAMLKERSK